MKILLYYEPSTFADGFSGTSSYRLIVDHLLNFSGKSLAGRLDVDFRLVLSEAAAFANAGTRLLDQLNPVMLTDEEVFDVAEAGSSFHALFLRMFHSRLSVEEEDRYAALIRRKLGSWEPDLIITFPVHNDYLKRIYPRALVLNNENGMFSRAPFPRCLRYEPCGYIRNFTNAYAGEIGSFPVPAAEAGKVAEFRAEVAGLVERFNPIREQIADLRSRFGQLVLLPIIWGNDYEESDYDDEFAFFNGIVASIPRDVGIIVTRHDNVQDQLNANVLPYLKAKFPNVIFHADSVSRIGCYFSPSLNYFGAVDAVLNCMTGTGLQALLWDTRVIAIDRSYSHWFSDGIGLDGLAGKLVRPVRDRTSLLYWYLTHYAVFERRYTDGDWLFRFLSDRIDRFRRDGITFGLFGQIEDIGDVAEYILARVRESLEAAGPFAGHPPAGAPERPSLGECLRWKICESLIPWRRERYAEKLRRCGF